MPVDILSDVLHTVRLTGAVFFDVECSSPWVEATPEGELIRQRVLPGAQHLVPYHMLTEGECWAGLLNEPPLRLEAGDVIVFPHGDAHRLASAPGLKTKPDIEIYRRPQDSALPIRVQRKGGGPSRAHLVCGYLGCDIRPFNPLVAALPRVLHISDRTSRQPGWLMQLVRTAAMESTQKWTGGEAVLGRLSELLFVEVLRRYLETIPPGGRGWLAGLKDPAVGRVLALIHSRPSETWTLEALGRAAGVSRSALAERFQLLVGQPPIQYLTQWRMQVAAGLLANGERVSSVALEVGYDSEAAFSRAFKKLVGVSPAAWREESRQATATPAAGRTPRRTRGPASPRRRSARRTA